MYKELWKIYGVKSITFTNDDGERVRGVQVFYTRSAYDETEKENWLFGGVSPSKPQWLSDGLKEQLLRAVNLNSDGFVYACYEPKGRFNKLDSFEACYDEEIILDSFDSGDSD